MPTYGSSKARDMARSVLPSTAPAGARHYRSVAHGRTRSQQRAAFANRPHDDDFDATGPCAERVEPAIREMVASRRGDDKLGPIMRWAKAKAPELGATPAERVVAIRALLPDGLIGEHAISHLRWLDEYDDLRRRRNSYPRPDASARAQSLRDRIRNGLLRNADKVGELNAALKKAWAATREDRPRLLAGSHDIDDFVADVVGAGAPHGKCTACGWYHQSRRETELFVVRRFLDLR